ncbi:hypothetical protein KJ781_04670, partial [Patescibacteria group bacterium]|nr:hypothetical protein [Patescibacteria group bacterium]
MEAVLQVDQHAFFHEGTIRICGSLDIHESLAKCYDFLKQYMPVQGIGINIHEPEMDCVRIIASYGELMDQVKEDQLITLSAEGLAYVRRLTENLDQVERCMLVHKVEENPIATDMKNKIGLDL